MNVLVRTDSSSRIGTGHLRRCLSLAKSLREFGAKVRFVGRDHGAPYDAIVESGFDLDLLPPGEEDAGEPDLAHGKWSAVDTQRDVAETVKAIGEWRPDWAIIDHYGFDARWHRAFAVVTGARIAAIDDLADRQLDCALLIDHNWHADHSKKYGALLSGEATILGGPRFALLDPAYSEIEPAGPRADVQSIGIFMGGADVDDATSSAIEAVRMSSFDGPVEIVSTAANPNLAKLQQTVSSDPQLSLAINLPNLAQFFVRHDLHIGAGGGASWERAYCGVPVVATIGADNQLAVLEPLAKLGALYLHPHRPIQADQLASEIDWIIKSADARADFAAAGKKLVDGRGSKKVAARMSRKSLREADTGDCEKSFYWRNHPATRRFSTDTSELQLDQHKAWWASALASADKKLLIFRIGTCDAGVLRFDVEGSSATVSIYLNPQLTGLGVGTDMLKLGRRWVSENLPNVVSLKAKIDDRNVASKRIFAKAGYSDRGGGTHTCVV